MNIEVGKLYKTRDGRKVEIISCKGRYVSPHGIKYPLIGYVGTDDIMQYWQGVGAASMTHIDLVAEWSEPVTVTRDLIWLHRNHNNETPFAIICNVGQQYDKSTYKELRRKTISYTLQP